MAFPIGAIPLTGAIGLTDVSDVFATHLSILGKGGHREVATITERNAITTERREFGMTVTVNADPTPGNNKTYQLSNTALGGTNNTITDNANWTIYNPAGVAPISFQNGLTETAGVAKLGGNLTEDTFINGAFQLAFGSATPLTSFSVSATTLASIGITGKSITLNSTGLGIVVDGTTIINKATANNHLFIQTAAGIVSSVHGGDLIFNLGGGYFTGNNNGGSFHFQVGAKNGTGVDGNYIFGETSIIDALGGALDNAGRVIYIQGATKNPIANPVGGGIFYSNASDAYKPYWRTPTGVTYDLTAGAGGGGGQVLIQFKDEGTNLGTSGTVNTVNFVGSGISAARVGDTVTVTVPTGVSNSKSQYFNGDGSTTQFTLSEVDSVQIFFVDVGGQVVENVADFTIDNVLKRVTFGTAPTTGQRIGIYYFTQLSILGGGGGTWGSITGTLTDQTDLNTALNGKVPTTRTLTINGTTLDLSANRTWTVGDVSTGGSYSNPSWITALDAAKITTGTLPLSVIPAAALERVYVYGGVATLPENAGLTTTEVQNGDVVKMNTTGIMYVVANDTALNVAGSYVAYNAGTAASVPWSGVTGTPTTLAGYGITNAWNTGTGAVLTANNTISGAFDIGFNHTRTGFGMVPATIATNTRVDILGINTGNALRVANHLNTLELLKVTNDGIVSFQNATVTHTWSGSTYSGWSTLTGSGGGATINVQNVTSLSASLSMIYSGASSGGAGMATNIIFREGADTSTGGTVSHTFVQYKGGFTRASGTNSYTHIALNPIYNTTSTYVGTAIGLDYNPTLTSVVGLTNIAFRATSGSVLIGSTTLNTGTRLDVRGIGTTSSTYALKVENSFGDDLFFIRDDGRISLGRDVDTNYREIIKSIGNASTTYGFGVFNSSDLLLGRFRDDQVFELGGDAAFITVTAGVAAGDAAIQFLPYTDGSGLAYRFQDTSLVDFIRFFNQTTTMRREVVMAQPVTYSYGSGEERQTKQYQIDSDGVANSENVIFEITLADAEHYDIKVLHADATSDDGTSITTLGIDAADVYKEASVNIQGNIALSTLSRIKSSTGLFNWNIDTTNQKIQYRFKSNTTGTKVFRVFVDVTLVKRITPIFE